jgi:hypothetical protein
VSAPDLTRKVVGFRAFDVVGGDLESTGQYTRWMPGPNRARCLNDTSHAAPVKDCLCGLYAYHRPPEGWRTGELQGECAAAVTAWGRIEVHRDGFRAEYAQVELLFHDAYCGPSRLREYHKAAEVYGIQVACLDDLDGHPLLPRLGDSIPESLWPEKPKPPEKSEPSAGAVAWPNYASYFTAPSFFYGGGALVQAQPSRDIAADLRTSFGLWTPSTKPGSGVILGGAS